MVNFDEVQFIIPFFILLAFDVFSKKNLCLRQYHSQISQYISPKTFDNFILLRPVIHFMLKFMYVKYVSKFYSAKGYLIVSVLLVEKNYPFSNQ